MEGWVKCKELLLSLSKSKVPGEDFAILDDLKTNLHLVSSLSIDLRRVRYLFYLIIVIIIIIIIIYCHYY